MSLARSTKSTKRVAPLKTNHSNQRAQGVLNPAFNDNSRQEPKQKVVHNHGLAMRYTAGAALQ